MACYYPVTAYQTANGDVVFDELKRYDIIATLQLPCGRCIGCRLERSRQWGLRCVHEASLHPENAFVTLTYDDEHLPADRSLVYKGPLGFQRFLKRTRKHFSPRTVRFFMGGEYGELLARPHFHACLFGIDFADKQPWSKSPSGAQLYRSATLEKLWPFGFSSVGEVNFETACYVARYSMKKVTGDLADKHYEIIDPDTGEVIRRRSEFCKMSLKPGIGAGWFKKWSRDVYPHDYVVNRGQKSKPPAYYDKLFKKMDPEGFELLKFERALEGRAHYEDNTTERLADREKVARARLDQFPRKLK